MQRYFYITIILALYVFCSYGQTGIDTIRNINRNDNLKIYTPLTQTDTAKYYDSCELQNILHDGSLLVKLNKNERIVNIFGILLPAEVRETYEKIILQGLQKSRKPCKCFIRYAGADGKTFVKILYYGWQDKSGDVWIDIATTLLSEGVVRVAKGNFSEKKEYLQNENDAKKQGKGIWIQKK